MRRNAFPLAMIALILLATFTFWMWWTDAVPRHKCAGVDGTWNAGLRTCEIRLTPVRATIASPTG